MHATLTDLTSSALTHLCNVTIIGRAEESDLVLGNLMASRRHAMIRRQDDGYWLYDLGSFNGCSLNGARLTTASRLNDGDEIVFADNEFLFNQLGQSQEPRQDMGSTVALIQSKSVIILVSDVQGFTSLSEGLPPDALAQVMGSWYSDCELIVAKYGAVVDKFIGDCVLAYWTDINATSLRNSLLAGRALLGSCHKLYEQHQDVFDLAERKFGAGVGIHTGEVAYGGMSQGEFTLIGDPVNATFRIEALTRNLEYDIVTTDEFMTEAAELKQFAHHLGYRELKGRSEPMAIWGIHSYPEEP